MNVGTYFFRLCSWRKLTPIISERKWMNSLPTNVAWCGNYSLHISFGVVFSVQTELDTWKLILSHAFNTLHVAKYDEFCTTVFKLPFCKCTNCKWKDYMSLRWLNDAAISKHTFNRIETDFNRSEPNETAIKHNRSNIKHCKMYNIAWT